MNEHHPINREQIEERIAQFDRMDDPNGKKTYLEKVLKEIQLTRLDTAAGRERRLSSSEFSFLTRFVKSEKAQAEKEFSQWCLRKAGRGKPEPEEAKDLLRDTTAADLRNDPELREKYDAALQDYFEEHSGEAEQVRKNVRKIAALAEPVAEKLEADLRKWNPTVLDGWDDRPLAERKRTASEKLRNIERMMPRLGRGDRREKLETYREELQAELRHLSRIEALPEVPEGGGASDAERRTLKIGRALIVWREEHGVLPDTDAEGRPFNDSLMQFYRWGAGHIDVNYSGASRALKATDCLVYDGEPTANLNASVERTIQFAERFSAVSENL